MIEAIRFRVWQCICAAAGLYLSVHRWDNSFLAPYGSLIKVLPNIGEALVVAGITAMVVDAAAKREMLKEFGRDVSVHIVGRLLPEHLREHMLRYLNSPFVRRNWNLTYTLVPWPGREEYLQLTTVSEYETENCSDITHQYKFFYEVNKSSFPDVGETRLVHVAISCGGKKEFEKFEQALEAHLTTEPDCRIFAHDIAIPRRPHPPYRFLAESIECFKDGYSPFVAPVAVLGLTVTIYYPKRELRVGLYLSTRPTGAVIETTELANGTQWHISEPLLPGQCVFTRWERIVKREAQADVAGLFEQIADEQTSKADFAEVSPRSPSLPLGGGVQPAFTCGSGQTEPIQRTVREDSPSPERAKFEIAREEQNEVTKTRATSTT